MTVAKLIDMIGAMKSELGFWGLVLLLLSIGVEFTPIKWNPWSAILGWIGSKLNSRLNAKLIEIGSKVDKLNTDLDKHIAESMAKEIRDTRMNILDFCNACMNKRKHTREQFEFVLKQCDDYERYIEENHVKNGVVDAAIKEIRRLNEKCIQENSYLKEGEDHD
jgi:hypothetical protein